MASQACDCREQASGRVAFSAMQKRARKTKCVVCLLQAVQKVLSRERLSRCSLRDVRAANAAVESLQDTLCAEIDEREESRARMQYGAAEAEETDAEDSQGDDSEAWTGDDEEECETIVQITSLDAPIHHLAGISFTSKL